MNVSSSSPPPYDEPENFQFSLQPPPRYSRRPLSGCSTIHTQTEVKEFTYQDGMMILTVDGDASLSDQTPTFMEGGKISGSLRLYWKRGQEIRSVTISARGRIFTGGGRGKAGDIYTFLDLPIRLWTKHMGHLYPDNVEACERRWSYSISLPKEITVSEGGPGNTSFRVFRLPHSFVESTSPAHVIYELVVRVKRRRWQKDFKQVSRTTFAANFSYRQGNRPHSIPLSRTINDELFGWKLLKPVMLKGTMFRKRKVELQYDLSLATPSQMCYNLGSSIHFFLVIKSLDTEALDILTAPGSVVLRLERRIRYRNTHMHAARSIRWLSVVDQLDSATWKLSRRPQEPTKRFLKGELRLKEDLSPSIGILNIAIEYMVTMYAFSGSGFRPSRLQSNILLSEPVEITTSLACSTSV